MFIVWNNLRKILFKLFIVCVYCSHEWMHRRKYVCVCVCTCGCCPRDSFQGIFQHLWFCVSFYSHVMENIVSVSHVSFTDLDLINFFFRFCYDLSILFKNLEMTFYGHKRMCIHLCNNHREKTTSHWRARNHERKKLFAFWSTEQINKLNWTISFKRYLLMVSVFSLHIFNRVSYCFWMRSTAFLNTIVNKL